MTTRFPLDTRSGRWMLAGAVLLAVLVIVATVMALSSGGSSQGAAGVASDSPAWYVVQKRDFDLTVTAAGELAAKENIEIKSRVEGANAIVQVVDEGAAVKKDDLLVKLADDSIKDKIEQEELNVEKAKADQLSAEQTLAIQENEAQSKQNAAEVKLALAELALSKWTSGDDPQKMRELDLALEKARRNLERAERDLELSKDLYAQRFISLNELEDGQIALIEAKNALATAELNIRVYGEFSRPKELRQVQADVEQARSDLDTTLRKNQIAIETARADLRTKERTLKIRQERLDKLKEQFELTAIRAPADGLVVYATSQGSRRWRGDPIAQGRNVQFNETIIFLPDTRQMVAELKVHEALMAQVRTDQPVNITIDAHPGTTLAGKVIQIGVMAEDGGWLNPDLREYKVRVELPPTPDNGQEHARTLKPGMRCSGQIIVGRVQQALAVPVQAVFARGEERYCYVPGFGGRVKTKPVKIGRSSETLVEIVAGLEAGDRVLLRKPTPGEAEAEKSKE